MATGARGSTGARGARGLAPMRPQNREPAAAKPPYEEKDIPSWYDRKFGNRLEDVAAEMDEVIKLQAQRKAIDEEIKSRMAVACAVMEDINKKESWSVRDEGWTLSYVRPKPRKTLVAELLIQQGVRISVIEKATKETPVTPFAVVTAKKQRVQEEE